MFEMFERGSDLLTQSHTRSQPTISSNNIGLVFFASQCCARLLKKDYNADDRRCINYSYHLFDKMIIMIIYDMMIIHDHDSDDFDNVDNVDDEGWCCVLVMAVNGMREVRSAILTNSL